MTPPETMMSQVQWVPCGPREVRDDGLPYATHTGTLTIAGMSLRCTQLSTGQRVILAEDLERFFGDLDLT